MILPLPSPGSAQASCSYPMFIQKLMYALLLPSKMDLNLINSWYHTAAIHYLKHLFTIKIAQTNCPDFPLMISIFQCAICLKTVAIWPTIDQFPT